MHKHSVSRLILCYVLCIDTITAYYMHMQLDIIARACAYVCMRMSLIACVTGRMQPVTRTRLAFFVMVFGCVRFRTVKKNCKLLNVGMKINL